jgi:hypothetical protein
MFVPVEHRSRRRKRIAVVGPQPFRLDPVAQLAKPRIFLFHRGIC